MSLLNSINVVRNSWVAVLTAFLLLGACATAPESATSVSRSPGRVSEATDMAGGDSPGIVSPGAATLYAEALASMAAAETIVAERRFKDFLLQYPDFPGAHVNLAIIFARRDDLRAAENYLTDALSIDPEHAHALNQLGMLLRRQGKFEAAEAAYLKAVTASPDYALAHHNLGVLNDLYLQRLDAALIHYERYQALNGEDKQVTKWISDLKRRLGRRQSTARLIE